MKKKKKKKVQIEDLMDTAPAPEPESKPVEEPVKEVEKEKEKEKVDKLADDLDLDDFSNLKKKKKKKRAPALDMDSLNEALPVSKGYVSYLSIFGPLVHPRESLVIVLVCQSVHPSLTLFYEGG